MTRRGVEPVGGPDVELREYLLVVDDPAGTRVVHAFGEVPPLSSSFRVGGGVTGQGPGRPPLASERDN
jgi:hypothetical protein